MTDHDDARAAWDQKADFWDALHGDAGNRFHRELVSPAVERLLGLKAGKAVLDVACGSGMLARRMAELGASVTAVDFSEALLARARARGQSSGPSIDYQVVDASAETALLALGENRFDAITCTMALMDMSDLGPLYRAVPRLLKPGGRFVIATAHPAFNSNNPIFVAEVEEFDGVPTLRHFIKLATYLDQPPIRGAGAPGEPTPHIYYHRPLHELLNGAFAAGLVLDGIDEPAFAPDSASTGRLSWYNFPQIPPVLACRLRPIP